MPDNISDPEIIGQVRYWSLKLLNITQMIRDNPIEIISSTPRYYVGVRDIISHPEIIAKKIYRCPFGASVDCCVLSVSVDEEIK